MKNSLVIELQKDAMESVVSITDLLRKAIVVARKLKVHEFQEWITLELYGYKKGNSVPEYRSVNGDVCAQNPYHGWQPVIIGDAETAKMLTSSPVMQPISELEKLVSSSKGFLLISFPPEVEQHIMNWADMPLRPLLRIDKSQIHGVLDFYIM